VVTPKALKVINLKKGLGILVEETLHQNKLDEHFERRVLDRLQGIVVVYIAAINLRESADWYVKYLGYQVTHTGDIWSLEKPGYLKIILSEIGCDTHPVQFAKAGDKNAVIMIGTPDFDDYYEFLKRNGVEVTHILDRGACGKCFQMKDPAGNYIMVDAVEAVEG
jgi:predicted enzyme related to lactoylglutathione lyase